MSDGQDSLSLWTRHVVLGMKYLSEKRIIHGDLATRNLLLLNERHVKISDFGLARQLQNYSIYKKNKQVSLQQC
jgi:serine/threonine protein kinase